jgi:DHA2 family methylenomycin A resistance protein-like MFS transporter
MTLQIACAAFFMVVLDTTVVNVALPSIERTLGGGIAGVQWIVDAYTLTFGALVLSAGAVADRTGASVGLGIGVAGFAASSAVCAIAPTLTVLVLARVCQGAAAALMVPSSLALINQAHADPRRRARAISIWAAAGGAAVAAGPIVGGLLTAGPGWRAVFFVNIPIAGVALAGLSFVPRSPTRPARLDVLGQMAATVALAAFTFSLIEGGHAGYDQPFVLAGFGTFMAAATLFVIVERRRPHAAVPVNLLASRSTAGALVVGLALYFGFYGVIFALSLYFQQVLHYGPAHAGLMFVPMTLLITAAALLSGRWSNRTRAFVPMAAGSVGMAIGFFAMAAVHPGSPAWAVALAAVPIGVGSGIAGPAVPIAILAALPRARSGIASGIANALRQVAATIGVAVFGSLLASHHAFAHGMRSACLVAAAALVTAVVVALGSARRYGNPALTPAPSVVTQRAP